MNSCFKCKIKLTFPIESQLVSLVIAHALLLQLFLLASSCLWFSTEVIITYSYQSAILAIVDTQIGLVLTFSSLGQVSAVIFYFNYCNCAQIRNAWLACIHYIASYLAVRISNHASSGHPCANPCQNTWETTATARIRSPSRHLLACTKGRTHPVNR